jgi:hypothetical protein
MTAPLRSWREQIQERLAATPKPVKKRKPKPTRADLLVQLRIEVEALPPSARKRLLVLLDQFDAAIE